MIFRLAAACIIFLSAGDASAQLSGEAILDSVETCMAGVHDYTVKLVVTTDIERLKVPPMHVTMYFKQPDKVHFDSEGFALLPREGVAFSITHLRKRYAVDSVNEEMLNGEKTFKLTLLPAADRSSLRRMFLYVNPSRWMPDRLASTLVNGREILATFTYQQIEGHWLPSQLVVKMTSSEKDTTEMSPLDQSMPIPRPPLARNGTVTIGYSDYRINTGLPDELFIPKEKARKE
jgi:outer membrane lipoprotein-sorting protein